jgi:hypothetical protein
MGALTPRPIFLRGLTWEWDGKHLAAWEWCGQWSMGMGSLISFEREARPNLNNALEDFPVIFGFSARNPFP